jgi:F0F1-type ATP synthase assembly protein I
MIVSTLIQLSIGTYLRVCAAVMNVVASVVVVATTGSNKYQNRNLYTTVSLRMIPNPR